MSKMTKLTSIILTSASCAFATAAHADAIAPTQCNESRHILTMHEAQHGETPSNVKDETFSTKDWDVTVLRNAETQSYTIIGFARGVDHAAFLRGACILGHGGQDLNNNALWKQLKSEQIANPAPRPRTRPGTDDAPTGPSYTI